MSIFDSPSDAPFQIKTEGETINLSFARGVPTSGQGTVSWNIPAPARGCQTENGAYCGFVVVAHDKPVQIENAPVDGTYYTADPTVNKDTHLGDKINGALVIGAFYEGEKKGRGEELTTSFVVSDLQTRTPYYIAGYAVDCQGRYHREGTRAYSDLYAGEDEPSTPSTQTIIMGENGVLPTDGTGLTPGFLYEFEIELEPPSQPCDKKTTVKVSVNGTDATTYADLLKEINKDLALALNPPQSPVPPNQGRYFWDGTNLFQWDGENNVLVNALIEPTDPASPSTGDYWYQHSTETLFRWDVPTAGVWNVVDVLRYSEDPTQLSGGNDYWYNGTTGYTRCGNTWCETPVIVSQVDPSHPTTPQECGEYWYDENDNILYEWHLEQNQWVQRFAILWNVAPNTLPVGTYWFNDTTQQLFIENSGWEEIEQVGGSPIFTGSPIEPKLVISTEQPTAPGPNLHWYNPQTEELAIWNDTLNQFQQTPVLVWPEDPTNIESCDLWWNSIDDNLYKWDIVNSEWDLVTKFTISETNPNDPPLINVGDFWYNPVTEKLYRWDGLCYQEVEFLGSLSNPVEPADGSAWFNPITETWSIWNQLPGGSPSTGWNIIDPITSDVDPFTISSGTLWFDTSTDVLYERVGTSWIAIPFVTTSLAPSLNEMWFDTTNHMLKQWDGQKWAPGTPIATVELDECGNIVFTSSATGSEAYLMILVPSGVDSGNPSNNLIATGTAGHDCIHYGAFENVTPSETSVTPEQFLFDFLSPAARITRQVYGTDGVQALPTYDQIGVGDDGSPDERRELAETIRAQLGYPTVEVELTPYQINGAIDRAIEEIRRRTSIAYKRGFFFLDIVPYQQHYKLTDKTVGFNKVVTVMSAYRMTSAFLSNAHGAGVYGQIVLQHLYNMGTFDLLSYHLVAQYVETMEHLFATRLTYHWHEADRLLSFYHSFRHKERILLDVTVERTEQEIFKDRWTKNWVEQWALAESMKTLSQIRGKYATLPGAGGGVALNATDLITQHDLIKERLLQEVDDMVVNDVEDIGMHSTFIIG